MKRSWPLVVCLLLGARPGLAQQFQQVLPALPGPVVWTEGVVAFDANGDGKTDILFANGQGFDLPMGALAPTLLINQTTTGGPITFVDETATRLPAGFTQQAKGVVAADVDGDGDLDVAFANAFGNQPSLLINNGSGVFTNETAVRFPVLSISSFGGGFGDVDNDGDIDLVFADAGASAFGSPGGTVRLFLNNGAGVFTNASAQMGAALKVGAQNAQMADVDNDFDLDVIVDGKSSGQQLYLNNGAGTFTLQASTLPAGSSATYATDFADLDNDNDLDAVYISLSGFNEGTVQNAQVPSGTLGFTGSSTTLAGGNGDDDNDVVFVDVDNDGILDPIVGSLGSAQEKAYRNAGTFAVGSFVLQTNFFTATGDSTLDLDVGDFDGDGRYDVVTGQGESGNFTNRVYRNTGPVDTRAPRIGRVQATPARVPLSVILAGGLVRRAWIQDATYKRGQTFARARADVSAVKDGATQSFSTPMRYVGGGLHRAVIQPAASPTGRVGMDVSWTVHATDPQNNASDSAPATFRICGAEGYGQGPLNSTGFSATVAGVGDPGLAANNFSLTLGNLPPLQSGVLLAGTTRVDRSSPFRSKLLFIGGTVTQAGAATADASGHATVTIDFTQPPFSSMAPGQTLYLQFRYNDTPLLSATNAIELVFCD